MTFASTFFWTVTITTVFLADLTTSSTLSSSSIWNTLQQRGPQEHSFLLRLLPWLEELGYEGLWDEGKVLLAADDASWSNVLEILELPTMEELSLAQLKPQQSNQLIEFYRYHTLDRASLPPGFPAVQEQTWIPTTLDGFQLHFEPSDPNHSSDQQFLSTNHLTIFGAYNTVELTPSGAGTTSVQWINQILLPPGQYWELRQPHEGITNIFGITGNAKENFIEDLVAADTNEETTTEEYSSALGIGIGGGRILRILMLLCLGGPSIFLLC